jgi:hypothetical protein
MQVCEKVDLYGFAPPLAVTARAADGRTRAAYMHYFDRTVVERCKWNR